MRRLGPLAIFGFALFMLWGLVVFLASVGEPQAAWLVCEVLNLDYCGGNLGY